MRTTKAWLLISIAIVGSLASRSAAAPAAAQVELDRVISRVYDQVITQLDVRQARLLKLFGGGESDAELRRLLENRLLMLVEVKRSATPEPAADRRAARRQELVGALGAPADLPRLLEGAGMTDSALDDWCRNDLRIAAYIEERFASSPDRARATETWLGDLRRRAGLK